MKNMQRSLAAMTLALMAWPTGLMAQEQPEVSLTADVVSHYMWRGMDKGGVSIQPQGQVRWQGATLQVQGSTGIDKSDDQEIDVSLGYRYGDFNVGVTDYWQTGKDYTGHDLYFSYDAERDAHQLEVNIGYTHRYFSVQAYTMVWGNDFKYSSKEDFEQYANGKRAFSTYIELSAPLDYAGFHWDVTAGFNPFESANGVVSTTSTQGKTIYQKDHFYAAGFSCVKASLRATRNLELGSFSLPVFAEFHANPYLKKANFLVGLHFEPFK